ncbi:MAG: hypothetical protein R3E79_07315 [Caldilineaceae bacterium]
MLGLLVGVVGIVSTIPALNGLVGVFERLSQLLWFVWVGIVLLRGIQPRVAAESKRSYVIKGVTPNPP